MSSPRHTPLCPLRGLGCQHSCFGNFFLLPPPKSHPQHYTAGKPRWPAAPHPDCGRLWLKWLKSRACWPLHPREPPWRARDTACAVAAFQARTLLGAGGGVPSGLGASEPAQITGERCPGEHRRTRRGPWWVGPEGGPHSGAPWVLATTASGPRRDAMGRPPGGLPTICESRSPNSRSGSLQRRPPRLGSLTWASGGELGGLPASPPTHPSACLSTQALAPASRAGTTGHE